MPKTPVTSIISLCLCLSFRICQLGCHWTDFLEILYWRCLLNCVYKFQVCLKSDTNIGHFTWRPKYVLCYCLTVAFAFPWQEFHFLYWELHVELIYTKSDFMHCDDKSSYKNGPEVFHFVDVSCLFKIIIQNKRLRLFSHFFGKSLRLVGSVLDPKYVWFSAFCSKYFFKPTNVCWIMLERVHECIQCLLFVPGVTTHCGCIFIAR